MDKPQWVDEEILGACMSPIHLNAVEGIKFFNQGAYFEAHEELETAWREEPGAIRDLYRGILLAGVTLLHMQRGNFEGALKVSQRCLKWLAVFGESCCGVQIGDLRRQMAQINKGLENQGKWFITNFNYSSVRPICYDSHWPTTLPKQKYRGSQRKE